MGIFRVMKDEKEPRILEVRLTKHAEKKTKTTEIVQLKLVSTERIRAARLDDPESWPKFFRLFFYPEPLGIQHSFTFRLIAELLMTYFTIQMCLQGYDSWFFQNAEGLNLLVHEAGHLFFWPAAWFGFEQLTCFMGSGAEFLFPCGLAVVYWFKTREIVGTSFALWWAFQTLIGVARYVEDSIVMQLMLTSGHTGSEGGGHDWNHLLTEWGCLQSCYTIGSALNIISRVGMILCLLWAYWSLFYYWFYQRKNVE